MAKKPAEEKGEEKTTAKIIQIVPAPQGMLAHYTKKNADELPVNSARNVVGLGLLEDGTVTVLTIEDIAGATIEAGEFTHVAF